jgi:hypothetical protein
VALAELRRRGVRQGPPNTLDEPKPASSISTTSTFGAPAGGRSGSIGGNDVSGSFASYVVSPTWARSGIGRTAREGRGTLSIWGVLLGLVEASMLAQGAGRVKRLP